ncbi:o-succinylbenzoate synthase [Psychroserpens mesophilus]|uniref:o-succinylbenzoate synthase n=1 Tax=Psychroserpens mesophilus TaxID=325473 RepID=UPI003D64E338
MIATFQPYLLHFKKASGTSRGILKTKETYFIILKDNHKTGIGECGLFRGLSVDDRPDFEAKLQWVCKHIQLGLEKLLESLIEYPSIQFGLEQAFASLQGQSPFNLYPSEFTEGKASIPINGLIWMGTQAFMKDQIKEKLNAGFDCLKMKIGAIDFNTELHLLKSIRQEFSVSDIELRVDANGAFTPENALEKLKRLSDYNLHSIEQPIKQGQFEAMAKLCEQTPLPIALDEELIGVFSVTKQTELLQMIRPQYIILKPSLVGGWSGSQQWINIADKHKIGSWITSALESNVGLNAIAQWTYTLKSHLPQGLGTGSLFTNNFESPLQVNNGTLQYNVNQDWNMTNLDISLKK